MNRIRDLRISNGWTQLQLGRKIGAAKSTISGYESGDRQLTPALINVFCDLFHCSADYLLCRSDTPLPALSDEDAAFLAAYHAAPENVRAAIDTLLRPVSELSAKKEAV